MKKRHAAALALTALALAGCTAKEPAPEPLPTLTTSAPATATAEPDTAAQEPTTPGPTVTDGTADGHGTSAAPQPATADDGDDALGIAVPLKDAGGRVVAALSVIVPCTDDPMSHIPALQAAAHGIRRELGRPVVPAPPER